jgi:redox-sensing transcriptional repressor
MSKTEIPDIVIGRLPLYLRALQRMVQEGRQVTSSQELGERLGISAAQIRKDLSQFGEFGKQGTGYNIEFLRDQLRQILKIDRVWEIAVVGAGDVGHALARYQGFRDRGFEVVVIFDSDPQKIGQKINDFVIRDVAKMKDEIQKMGIKVAMVATPASFAQDVVDQLVEAGVQAILNYAPIQISTPQTVRVQFIDPATHLQRMSYYLEE